jgi:uncharacterized protein YhaN
MKFRRVNFRSFGPFEDQLLDLSGPDGLHVVFGPNEAGKSSALRGLHAFLFGFPVQSGDDFRFKYNQFRVRALLENSASETLECIRRKGKKATLLATDDRTEIAESSLAKFLGGLQQHQFDQLFGLDSRRLDEGGREIATGQGDLGEALFAAGAGLAGLRILAQSLEDRQLSLYKPRGQTQPINKALSDHKERLEAVRKSTLPPDVYAAAAIAASGAQDKAEALRRERITVRSRLGLLQRFQAALPTIELYQRAQKRLEPVAQARFLADDFDARLRAAREKREIARNKLRDLGPQREDLERQLHEKQPGAALLAEETEIDELKKLVGADSKQHSEAIRAETRRSQEEAKARDIFRQLTGTTAWNEMSGLEVRLDHEQRIAELANDHKAVLEDVANCERALQLAREALAVAEGNLASAPAATDSAPWLAAMDSIAALGPIEQQARTRQSEAANEELKLSGQFGRLQPRAGGAWSDAASLPVPSTEAVARFRQQFDEAQRAVDEANANRQQIEDDIVNLRGQIADLGFAEAVPTTNDLTDARRDRDGGLHLIRRRLAGEADVASEVEFAARHAPGRPLIDAAEVSVRQCDALADRLRHDADRVALWQTRHQKLELLQTRREEAGDIETAARSAHAEVRQAWQAAWGTSTNSPESPEVMQPWLIRWHQFTEKVTAWHAMRLKCGEDEQLIASLRAQLAGACPITRQTKTLAEGLALARQAIADAKNDQAAAEKLKDEVLRRRSALDTALRESARASRRRDEWIEQWSRAIAVLGLGESTASIETVQDYVRSIGEMQQHLTDMRINAAAVREIDQDRASLLERVTALRMRLDPAARPSTAETLGGDFREVDDSLATARTRRTQHAELAKQLRKVEDELASTSNRLSEAEAALAALASQAGVSSPDEIDEAVQRASERVLASRQVQEQENALAQNSRGQPLDEFVAAAFEHRDLLDRDIESLDRRALELDPEIADAEAQALKAEQVLEGYRQASDAAALARQQAELVASRLEERVIEFAALHVARVALDRAKERYRARHQDSLLDRAGEFFKTLTDHAFEGLDIDNEEGSDVLKAVRASGHSNPRVSIGGLSDGTRDQLFLALRLAGIEQHLVDREPVPLIIDDVLMTFDDARARSTLACLVKLAAKTQVLLFTHHRHVVDLARSVHPGTVVHELVPAVR